MNARSDGSPLTSAVSVFVTIDGGVQTAGGGTLTHEGNGHWSYVPTQAETNGNHIAFTFTHASGVHQTVQVYTISYDPHDTAGLGLSRIDAAVTTRLAPTVAGRTLDVTLAGEAGLDLDNTVGTLSAAEIPNLDVAVSTRAIAGDAMALTAAAINLIWDELTSEGRTVGSYGQLFKDDINATIASRAIAGDAMNLVAGAVSAAAVATNAIDADALATDAVNEIRDAILAAVLSELPQAAPPATPQLSQAVMLLYMAVRNMLQVTATEKRISNDAGTVIAKKALTDDGTTFQEAEMVSGP